MYEFLLAVHVLAAVIWVGGAVTLHIFGRFATKEGPERQLAFTGESIRIGNMVYAPLAVVLLIAGILLVDEVGYSYGDPWITIGFLGFLVSFVLGGRLLRAGRQALRRGRGGRGSGLPCGPGDLPAHGRREHVRAGRAAARGHRHGGQAGLRAAAPALAPSSPSWMTPAP